jgi:hypothetical protein
MVHQGRHYDDFEVVRYSREWWAQVLRNVFWVAVVTLMIWVYADLEISEPREFTVTLRLTRKADGGTALVGQREWSTTFSAKGSRRDLTRFERWLVDNEDTIEVDVSDYRIAEHDEPTSQLLSRSQGVLRHNLEVQSITPKQIPFRVEALETRSVPVQFDYVNATIQNVKIEPSEVSVVASTSVWGRIDDATDAPVVRTRQEDLTLVDPDDNRSRTIPLVPLIEDVPVMLDRSVVAVSFQVKSQPETRTFEVAVRRNEPSTWEAQGVWSTLELVRREAEPTWTYSITVAGAARDLQRLNREDIRAFIELTDADRDNTDQWIKREVMVYFPPDSKVRLADRAPTIEFKLTPRQP